MSKDIVTLAEINGFWAAKSTQTSTQIQTSQPATLTQLDHVMIETFARMFAARAV